MSDRDLLFLPATTTAAMIRRGELSPVELVDAVLSAIDADTGSEGQSVRGARTWRVEAAPMPSQS